MKFDVAFYKDGRNIIVVRYYHIDYYNYQFIL